MEQVERWDAVFTPISRDLVSASWQGRYTIAKREKLESLVESYAKAQGYEPGEPNVMGKNVMGKKVLHPFVAQDCRLLIVTDRPSQKTEGEAKFYVKFRAPAVDPTPFETGDAAPFRRHFSMSAYRPANVQKDEQGTEYAPPRGHVLHGLRIAQVPDGHLYDDGVFYQPERSRTERNRFLEHLMQQAMNPPAHSEIRKRSAKQKGSLPMRVQGRDFSLSSKGTILVHGQHGEKGKDLCNALERLIHDNFQEQEYARVDRIDFYDDQNSRGLTDEEVRQVRASFGRMDTTHVQIIYEKAGDISLRGVDLRYVRGNTGMCYQIDLRSHDGDLLAPTSRMRIVGGAQDGWTADNHMRASFLKYLSRHSQSE